MINLDLSGKKAVVTGASLGIGEATVKMLAEHGADVFFCARTEESVQKNFKQIRCGFMKSHHRELK